MSYGARNVKTVGSFSLSKKSGFSVKRGYTGRATLISGRSGKLGVTKRVYVPSNLPRRLRGAAISTYSLNPARRASSSRALRKAGYRKSYLIPATLVRTRKVTKGHRNRRTKRDSHGRFAGSY